MRAAPIRTGRVFLLAIALAGVAPACAELPLMLSAPPVRLAAPAYRLQPSAVALPADAAPGSVSRTIIPYGPWTLICDVQARRRVCMASQTILDAAGMVFSWSLAGTDGGGPVLILRAPARAEGPQAAHLDFGSGERREVELARCTEVCVGYLPVDAAIARAIRAGVTVGVATATMPTLAVPLRGLASAVASLK